MDRINMRTSIIMALNWMRNKKRLCSFPLLSEEQIRHYQLERIKKVVTNAYLHVPFYKNLFDGIHFYPDDLKTFSDFEKIPTISKRDLLNNEDSFLDERYRFGDYILSKTSGTSGAFLNVYCAQNMFAEEELQVIRMIKELYPGYGPFSREVLVYTSKYPVSSMLGFYRAYYVNNLLPFEKIFDFIRKKKPSVLAIYPSILRGIVNTIDYSFNQLGIKLIITNSEQSTQEERDKFSAIFGCKVIDEFSSEELQSIAYQCIEKRYHEVSDCTYIELLDICSDKPVNENEMGEITGTCLINPAMPLIRYRQGDFAIRTSRKCSCGKHTPIIGKPLGRIISSFVTKDGKIIPSGVLLDWSYSLVLRYNLPILEFKIVQETVETINLFIKAPLLTEFDQRIIEEDFMTMFNSAFSLNVILVDSIPYEKNGKNIPIISKVPLDNNLE